MDYKTLYELKMLQCDHLLSLLGRVRTYLLTGPRSDSMNIAVAKAIEQALPEED